MLFTAAPRFRTLAIPETSATLWINLFLCAATLVLMGAYLMQMAQGTEAGFRVRTLESATEQLRAETEQLSLGVTEVRRMESVMARLHMLGLVKPERMVYVTDTAPIARN